MSLIPHSRPWITDDDVSAVVRVLRSGQIAQGPVVRRLESVLARRTCRRYAVALSSGSAALHLALLALRVGERDEVIIPSYVCTALLNAVKMVGAQPVVVDVDETLQIDARKVGDALTPRTRAIIVPHMFGGVAPVEEITNLGVPVIEDCAQAVGAFWRGRPVGGFGTVSIFSFYATKVLCGGEGGAVATDDENVYRFLKEHRQYDESSDAGLRFNYKLSDLHAALALSQLERLDEIVSRRREIAERFDETIRRRFDSRIERIAYRGDAVFFRYVIMVDDLPRAMAFFRKHDIVVRRPVFSPIHRYLNISESVCPVTEWAFEHALSVPAYPPLRKEELERICAALLEV